MKKAEIHWSQIASALIVLAILVLIILFLANINDLKELVLKLTSFD